MSTEAVRHVLDHLQTDPPDVPDHPTEADLQALRDRIDALDTVLLKLLNERVACAHVIGDIKKQLGMPIYVPNREDEVLQHMMTDNTGPLPDTAVKHLFERIIDETRSLQRREFQHDADPKDSKE